MSHPLQLTTCTMAASIVVIDADEIARTGFQVLLERHTCTGEIVALGHDQALARTDWDQVHVVVIDPVDIRRPGDQVPGAAVVEHIRSCSRPDRPRIVVISSHQPDDVVRLRLREAGADAYFHRSQVREADRLFDAVFHPVDDEQIPPPVDTEALHRLGINARSRINAGVRAAIEERLVPEAGWVGPRGRDRFARRARFNQQALLQPVSADGLVPERPQEVPSLAQVQRFVLWATRVAPPHRS